MAALSAYGKNPNDYVQVNEDHGWGGYQWPTGVPGNLQGVAVYKDIRVVCRRELMQLFSLALRIAAEKHNYRVYTHNPDGSGEVWGPWGYENRKISGSNTPSNHSRGKAMDWNAPRNPYASGARFQSDFPVAMVADLESIGLCWGGRYGDSMHWEYGYSPGDVDRHVKRALGLLGGAAITIAPTVTLDSTPTTSTDEDAWLTVGAREDIMQAIAYGNDKIMAGKNGEAPDDNIAQVKALLVALDARIAALETRVFDRTPGSQSIVDEIHYGNDAILTKLG